MSITPRSIAYAVRELGRRAGVDLDSIARWEVTLGEKTATLDLGLPNSARVTFPFDRSKAARFQALVCRGPATFEWIREPSGTLREAVPSFIVPFEEGEGGGPLFVTNGDVVECRADILTASLWTMARREELESAEHDAYDRFPSTASIAQRHGFIQRPIVDEYALGFAQAISYALPTWHPDPPELRVKLSHDIDLTGVPLRLRTLGGHICSRHHLGAFFEDLLASIGRGRTAYLNAALALFQMSASHRLDSAFYWMTTTRTTEHDSGYDVRHPMIRDVIEELSNAGAEIGIHPSYCTFGSQAELDAEVARLRELVGTASIGGRQHYLRWNPSSWKAWERAGLVYDSSVGFADCIGFRAGTAFPYHPWLIDEDRESALLEIPLIVMDSTPVRYMHLSDEEVVGQIEGLVRRCALTGGVFTLLWHNTSIVEQPYARLYPRILELIRSSQSYAWRNDLRLAPLPRVIEPAAAY